MALKKKTLKLSPLKATSTDFERVQLEEEVVELDIIQRLHRNIQALKERQERLAFMTGEIQSVLDFKKKK